MKNLRKIKSIKIWLPVLVIGVVLWYFVLPPSNTTTSTEFPQLKLKRAPLAVPSLPPPPPPGPSTLDIIVKVGSALGGVMTLLNIVERVVNMVKKK